MPKNKLNRSDVISLLEAAGVEVQQDAKWAELRPLYDDLIKKWCGNLAKAKEEKVESKATDKKQQTATTTTVSSEHVVAETQTNESTAATAAAAISNDKSNENETVVTVERTTSETDEKSEQKPVQAVKGQQQNEQNQSNTETHSDAVEHIEQKQKNGNDVTQLKFGTFGDTVHEQTVYNAIPIAQKSIDQTKQAKQQCQKEAEEERRRLVRIMEQQHKCNAEMQRQQKLQAQRWAEAEATTNTTAAHTAARVATNNEHGRSRFRQTNRNREKNM